MRRGLSVITIWLAVLGFGQRAAAQTVALPTIHNVTLQESTGVLTISGSGLGANVVVTVDGRPVPVMPGATATDVRVLAPANVLTMPGTYRLTVVDPAQKIGDAFIVASQASEGANVGVLAGAAPGRTVGTAPSVASAPRGLPAMGALSGAEPRGTAGQVSPALLEDGVLRKTAVGYQALPQGSGVQNTASGYQALFSSTTGHRNTGTGAQSLHANTTGSWNTAVGADALFSNTTGTLNTGIGYRALVSNSTGDGNTGSGYRALGNNTTGEYNVASGFQALERNTTGLYNTASGANSLNLNTASSFNTASGYGALFWATAGSNTASGYSALYSTTTGSLDTALGYLAGYNATTGSYNLFLGAEVRGTASDTNTIRIGLPYDSANGSGQNQTFIAGIHGTQVTAWRHVVIDANGQLGTIDPQSGGGALPASAVTEVVQLQQQMQDQQATIAELRARLARLEALLVPATRVTN